tara:strand:+ start:105 stop:599 length:495 start_codon:yes stop_codon:yes gene_type:complete
MKKLSIYILILIPVSVFSQKNDDTTKSLLDSLSKNQIQYLCNGKITKYLDLYSNNYTDLGGGLKGDGTADFNSWKEKLEKFISSEEFNEIEGKSIDEVLDVEKQEILNYYETVKKKGEIKRFSFLLKEGDYLLSYPSKEGSPLSDGWFGIFRFENGDWKIIAGD